MSLDPTVKPGLVAKVENGEAKDLENGQVVSGGRTWKRIPTRAGDGNEAAGGGGGLGGGVCCILLIVGGILYAVAKPDCLPVMEDDCDEKMLRAGRIMMWVGGVGLGSLCACVCAAACCLGLASRD